MRKNITIDLEAYNRLCGHKRPGESFSDLIKRLVRPAFDVREWVRTIEKCQLSPEALEAIEEQVQRRSWRPRGSDPAADRRTPDRPSPP